MASRHLCAKTLTFCALAACSALLSRTARAEKILLKNDDGEVFTDGRVGGFLSYAYGDALPRSSIDANGDLIHDIQGGGLFGAAERTVIPGTSGQFTQGTIRGMRVRSGFLGNALGLGVRTPWEGNTVSGYIQFWAFVENDNQRRAAPNPVDVRQGYAKVDGPWGSVLVGRSRALFSRGATDIDVAYAHRYGVGYPGQNLDAAGPTSGHVGFGVLGSGFAAGFVYASPVLAGLQLTLGVFEPVQLVGAWTRTNWARPEGELTFEQPLGTNSKLVLFGNGAYQKLYKPDSTENTHAGGFGYGGRIEVGPVHLGVAGHYGKGLGLKYALEASDATLDALGNLRKFDGYYVQSQVVLGPVDLSAGWGITRVFLNPADSVTDAMGRQLHSVIKYQMGISGGVVYHLSKSLHLDFDYFRAQFAWFLGEKQVVNIFNTGMMVTW